jgi:hypothetical protein
MWEEHELYELPEGSVGLQVMSDGAHALSLLPHPDGSLSLVWDGVPGEPYSTTEGGTDNTFMSSADGKHVAFWATRGDDSFIVADGVDIGPFDAWTRNVPPTFASNGRLAFGASPRGQLADTGTLVPYLFVDDALRRDLPLAPVPAVFSPDGSRLAYAAQAAPQMTPRWVVVDERRGEDFEDVGMLGFSADSRRFFHKAQQGGRWRFVLDGEMGPPVDDVLLAAVSPDSRRHLYLAAEGGSVRLFVDGTMSPDPDVRYAMFSPDSQRIGSMVVGPGGRAGYVVDGRPEPLHKGVRHSAAGFFSPDSRHYAYIAGDEEGGFLSKKMRWYLVRDGERVGEAFDDIGSDPEFSPDSSRVVFAAQRDRSWSIAVDGHEGDPWAALGGMRWATDGRLGYFGRSSDGKVRIVVDGQAGPAVDEIRPWDGGSASGLVAFAFSPDGRHVAAPAIVGGRARPMLDDDLGPEFDSVHTPHFSEGRASFIGLRGRRVTRVSRPLSM